MITTAFLMILTAVLNAIFWIIPDVSISDIPLIGSVARDSLITAVSYLNSFTSAIPYFQLPWNLFVFVILPFEITLLSLKFILGHRLPINHIN